MENLNKIQQFQLFCIESYRNERQLSGLEALKLFKKYKVFEYLAEGYEVLHSQGRNFIIDDIEKFIELRQ